MARVTIENEAWDDPRYPHLAELLKLAKGAAPHIAAIGLCSRVWSYCADQGRYSLPASAIDAHVGVRGLARHMVTAKLAEQLESGEVRVCGTRGRIEWLTRLRESASAGGKAKAAKRLPNHLPKGMPNGNPNGMPNAVPRLMPNPLPSDLCALSNSPEKSSNLVVAAESSRARDGGDGPIVLGEDPEIALAVQGRKWFAAWKRRDDYDHRTWQRELAEIARKPQAERDLVAAALAVDPWVQANLSHADPRHVLKRWAKYRDAKPMVRVAPDEVVTPGVQRLRDELAQIERDMATVKADPERGTDCWDYIELSRKHGDVALRLSRAEAEAAE